MDYFYTKRKLNEEAPKDFNPFFCSARISGAGSSAGVAGSRLWGKQEEEILDEGCLLKPAKEGPRKEVRMVFIAKKVKENSIQVPDPEIYHKTRSEATGCESWFNRCSGET